MAKKAAKKEENQFTAKDAEMMAAKLRDWDRYGEVEQIARRAALNAEAPDDPKGVIPWVTIITMLLQMFQNCKPQNAEAANKRIKAEIRAARMVSKDHCPLKVRLAVMGPSGVKGLRKQNAVYCAIVSQASAELDLCSSLVAGYTATMGDD